MGKMPNKIFVEVTRENQESKDPESKKSALQNIYNKHRE